MNRLVSMLIKGGILKDNLDDHFIRASLVVVYLFFGYQKWFNYEAQALIPYNGHGPLIFWMYLVFGVRGAPLGCWESWNGRLARCCFYFSPGCYEQGW